MIKKINLIVIMLTALNSISQTKYSFPTDDFIQYHQKISIAERMFKHDSLIHGYARYSIAFDSYKGAINVGHYFKAALCALKIKEEFKALEYLEKAIKGGYEVDSMYTDAISFYNKNTKEIYQTNLSKWENEGRANKNSNWENELYASVQEGKKYTTANYVTAITVCTTCLKNPKCSKTTPDFTSKYKLVKEKRKADSIVAIKLLDNIKQNGFPTLKLMDKRACKIAQNILLNYDNDKTNDKLNPMLFKALTEGNISPAFYASVIDRRNLLNGQELEFYEPLMGSEKTIGTKIGLANKSRSKIGLYNIIMPNALALKAVDPKNTDTYTKAFEYLYDY